MLKMLERFWFGCRHCPGKEGCPLADQAEGLANTGNPYSCGLPLAAWAAIVFLLPLITAVGGTYIADRIWADGVVWLEEYWRAAGLIIGLMVGVGMAKLLLFVHQRQANASERVE